MDAIHNCRPHPGGDGRQLLRKLRNLPASCAAKSLITHLVSGDFSASWSWPVRPPRRITQPPAMAEPRFSKSSRSAWRRRGPTMNSGPRAGSSIAASSPSRSWKIPRSRSRTSAPGSARLPDDIYLGAAASEITIKKAQLSNSRLTISTFEILTKDPAIGRAEALRRAI